MSLRLPRPRRAPRHAPTPPEPRHPSTSTSPPVGSTPTPPPTETEPTRPDTPDGSDAGLDVLVVCTANVCRSPMGEALLRNELDRVGVRAIVTSAGFLPGGQPVHPHSVQALLIDHGLAVGPDRRSRQIDVEMLQRTDLVLTMTREHVRRIVELVPGAFARTFTLKELVRRASTGERRMPDEAIAPCFDRVALESHRALHELLGSNDLDDVADPIGQPRAAYRITADELSHLARRAASVLAGDEPS